MSTIFSVSPRQDMSQWDSSRIKHRRPAKQPLCQSTESNKLWKHEHRFKSRTPLGVFGVLGHNRWPWFVHRIWHCLFFLLITLFEIGNLGHCLDCAVSAHWNPATAVLKIKYSGSSFSLFSKPSEELIPIFDRSVFSWTLLLRLQVVQVSPK